jgi:hypothetical protein
MIVEKHVEEPTSSSIMDVDEPIGTTAMEIDYPDLGPFGVHMPIDEETEEQLASEAIDHRENTIMTERNEAHDSMTVQADRMLQASNSR